MEHQKKKPFRLKRGSKAYVNLCKQVYERDGFCVWCGSSSGLTPAHIVRVGQGGEDTLENISAGCMTCHADFDQYRIELPERVWNRMTDEHREQYLKTRPTDKRR